MRPGELDSEPCQFNIKVALLIDKIFWGLGFRIERQVRVLPKTAAGSMKMRMTGDAKFRRAKLSPHYPSKKKGPVNMNINTRNPIPQHV